MSNSKRKAHCNKIPHPTLLGAQIALKKMIAYNNKKENPIIHQLSAYRCPFCPNWHVGRSMKKGIDWDAVAKHDAKIKERCQSTHSA